MAKPGEHTYAPITCARTNPTWYPLPSVLSLPPLPQPVARHCALCLQFQLWLFPLCLPCQHDIWRVDIFIDFGIYSYCRLSVPPAPPLLLSTVPFPSVSRLAFPVAVVFLQPESWLRMSAVPCWGPFPVVLCLSLCVRVCGRTRCHIAHTPSGTNWTWAHAGTA